MKAKTKTVKKEFDTVRTFREIKDKISEDIKGMNYEQLLEYFEKTKLSTENQDKAD